MSIPPLADIAKHLHCLRRELKVSFLIYLLMKICNSSHKSRNIKQNINKWILKIHMRQSQQQNKEVKKMKHRSDEKRAEKR